MNATNQHPARPYLAVALDVEDLERATDIARAVSPFMSVGKVGLQLFASSGPGAIETIRSTGLDVFLDLKLHDIPNTVGSAARELGTLGCRFVTVHASGGEAMMRAAVEGLAVGAERAGVTAPMVLAVTVLTSDTDAPPELLTQRLTAAVAAGCPGVVCAAPDLPIIKTHAPDIFAVTPGIRMPDGAAHDQARVSTPGDAIAAGASLLVIGRAVTAAGDPDAVATAASAVADDARHALAPSAR